jgi:hypothetical protein
VAGAAAPIGSGIILLKTGEEALACEAGVVLRLRRLPRPCLGVGRLSEWRYSTKETFERSA